MFFVAPDSSIRGCRSHIGLVVARRGGRENRMEDPPAHPRGRPFLWTERLNSRSGTENVERAMSDLEERPRLREHMSEIRKALHAIGKDVEIDVADAPHLAKEGTKNAFAAAAGVRRKPIRGWEPPPAAEPANKAD